MGYQNRRYRVVDGKLEKRWDAPVEGWFMTKAEAWAAVKPPESVEAVETHQEAAPPPERVPLRSPFPVVCVASGVDPRPRLAVDESSLACP